MLIFLKKKSHPNAPKVASSKFVKQVYELSKEMYLVCWFHKNVYANYVPFVNVFSGG